MASFINEINEKTSKFSSDFSLDNLYGDFNSTAFQKRTSLLQERLYKVFGFNPYGWFSSPGRIEICGNHTDHNNGKVLCASVSLDTLACVAKTEDNIVRIQSEGYPIISVDLNDLQIKSTEKSSSTALVRGVCAYFAQNGMKTGGFSACADSNVFKGAGISSSASFELLIAEILNVLYNNGCADEIFKAKAAHYAESVYFGKPCGLLDQCAISFGGVCYIDFLGGEPAAQRLSAIPPLSVILVNAGGDHSSLTPQYAAIRSEMCEVATALNGNTLRDISPELFYSSLPELRKSFSGRALLRAAHYFEENIRVDSCKSALENGDISAFCNAVNASGDSSMCKLQNCYPNGDTVQLIPSAVLLLKSLKGVKAARVHGGGFAGTVLAFAEQSCLPELIPVLNSAFGEENFFVVNLRTCGTCRIPSEFIGENK